MKPDPGQAGHGSKPWVLIFAHSLLNKSMNFIVSHATALTRHDPFYVGAHRSKSDLELLPTREATANSAVLTGRRECLRRWYGYAPGFHHQLAVQERVLMHAHFGTNEPIGQGIVKHLGFPLAVTFHDNEEPSVTAANGDCEGQMPVRSFVKSPDRVREFGKAGRQFVEKHFDLCSHVGGLENIDDRLRARY